MDMSYWKLKDLVLRKDIASDGSLRVVWVLISI